MNDNSYVIGLMSGTSMDGIDATILKTDGITFKRTNINKSIKYSQATKDILLEAQNNPLKFIKNRQILKKVNKLVTLDHISLVENIVKKSPFKPNLIGFHGQTIYHSYEKKKSIQIGDPQLISDITNTKVVSSFRQNDMENGGQGAPLSPIYHMAMAKKMKLKLPISFLNIGGVANITYYDDYNLIGFDTGPGNGLMDLFCQQKLKRDYDYNGQLASKGLINKKILNKLKSDVYFKKKFPKSLDKLFFQNYLNELLLKRISKEDVLATLLEFTTSTISDAFSLLPKAPNSIILLGGGQLNTYLVKKLKECFSIDIFLSKQVNLPGQYIEAELFAYLAARTFNKLPITFPLTTGVKHPLIGGKVFTPNYIKACS